MSITAGCDVIEPHFAIVVGFVGAFVYKASVDVRLRLRIDDVVDAFAVHGACGAWGCVAVGVFHTHLGLIVTGDPSLLGVQMVGVLSITALAVLPVTAISLALHKAKVLRVTASQEVEGLDAEFGLKAYVSRSQSLARCSRTAEILRSNGYTPSQLLDALTSLRGIIYRPLTPQAADNKLYGEVTA